MRRSAGERTHVLRGLLLGLAAFSTAVLFSGCGGGSEPSDDGGKTHVPHAELELTLSAPDSAVAVGGSILLTVALRNQGPDRVTLVKPARVPSIVSFDVKSEEGGPLPYRGPRFKLPPPGPNDVVELAPGEFAENVLDLSKFYTLEPGRYLVTAAYHNSDDGSRSGFSIFTVENIASAPVHIEISR